MKKLPIGLDDFKAILDNKYRFVDKSLFIRDIIDEPVQVLLIARPRRFGKTLNLSMLRYFFEKSPVDRAALFHDLAIWQQGERYTSEQGKYPIITLTFKSTKMQKWSDNYQLLSSAISNEFRRHRYLMDDKHLSAQDARIYLSYLDGNASESAYGGSMAFLSKLLSEHYGENTIILLDEYDTLLNEAWIHGFYDEAIAFLRVFMNETFKNNLFLKKGIITGIFRVAKESIFSDMNNLKVSTLLSENYKEYFGFTEKEVLGLLEEFGMQDRAHDVASWYNGYRFGMDKPVVIYNPWSIVMFFNEKFLKPYWVNTSGNAIIRKLATEGKRTVQLSIQDLLEGKSIPNVQIDENIIYSEIMKSDTAIWSFMLMSGYLKPETAELRNGNIFCTLVPPNQEIYHFFRNMMRTWFEEATQAGDGQEMLSGLVNGELPAFRNHFTNMVLRMVSFNDVGDDTSESFYHAFVLGMLVTLDGTHEVKSNRESGYGRYDVMIIPRDLSKKGVVIEFKKADRYGEESIESALDAAMVQIEEKRYVEELHARGVKDVVKLGIAFKGKKVLMRMGEYS